MNFWRAKLRLKQFSPCLLAGLALTASAHHSTAMFDPTKELDLTGTIKGFRFTNPHSWIYLVVNNEKGEQVWEIECGSVSQMARQGWTYKSLTPGEKVTVKINPRVDNTTGGSFRQVQLQDGTVLSASPRI